MKIRLLANGSRLWERWIRRWGLSFMIDDDVLFDAFGDARVLMRKLRRFRVDVSRIRHAVISHEHWDHVEGLFALLKFRSGLKVYVPSHLEASLKEKIRTWGGDVTEVDRPVLVKPGVSVSGEIMGRYDGKDMPEQAMVLETGRGLVVLSGCAHPGIMTMVEGVQNYFQKPVYGVWGGFHLKGRPADEVRLEAVRLKSSGVTQVAPLHCTGRRAEYIFRDIFGSGCLFLRKGQVISLE